MPSYEEAIAKSAAQVLPVALSKQAVKAEKRWGSPMMYWLLAGLYDPIPGWLYAIPFLGLYMMIGYFAKEEEDSLKNIQWHLLYMHEKIIVGVIWALGFFIVLLGFGLMALIVFGITDTACKFGWGLKIAGWFSDSAKIAASVCDGLK